MKNIITLGIYLFAITVIAQTTANVGGNPMCGSSTNSNVPAKYNGFTDKNSWSGVIYKGSDINSSAGNITKIAFIADCNSSECDFDLANNQKVYMKLTTDLNFSSTSRPDETTMTQVLDGSIQWKRGTGSPYVWSEITLDTPFAYDGTSNLLIYTENYNGAELGGFLGCGESPSYLVNNIGENAVVYDTFSGETPSGSGSLSNQTPLLQLTFDGTLSNNTFESENVDIVSRDANVIFTVKRQAVYNVSVFDLKGQRVNTFEINSNTSKNLSQLAKGVYIVNIESNSGETFSKKIVLN